MERIWKSFKSGYLGEDTAKWVLYNVQQSGSVPQVSNSRLSPLPHEPAFAGSAAANDATVDIPLGGAKVSEIVL